MARNSIKTSSNLASKAGKALAKDPKKLTKQLAGSTLVNAKKKNKSKKKGR